jgi:hypothetical protein
MGTCHGARFVTPSTNSAARNLNTATRIFNPTARTITLLHFRMGFSRYVNFAIIVGGTIASIVAGSMTIAWLLKSHDKRYSVVRDGVNFTVFEHGATHTKMEYVTNSGICEMTPNVTQHSGFISDGTDKNM